MKTKSKLVSFLVWAVALGALATSVYAGPGVQYWQRTKPITTFTEAKSVGPDDMVMMQCKSCKTAMVRSTQHVGPPGKGRDEWFALGSKHTCDECKGEITVVKGKTEDSMQHNCSKCGEASVACCAVMAEKT